MDVVHRAYYAAEMNNPLSYYYALAWDHLAWLFQGSGLVLKKKNERKKLGQARWSHMGALGNLKDTLTQYQSGKADYSRLDIGLSPLDMKMFRRVRS